MEKDVAKKFDLLLFTVKEGFDELSEGLGEVKDDVRVLKDDVKDLKSDMKVVKSTMPTKDFVSEKNADLGAEIGKRINRANEEQRLFARTLVKYLREDKSLKLEHLHHLEEMLA